MSISLESDDLRSNEPEAMPCNCPAASAQDAEIRRLNAKLQQCYLDFKILIELYRIRNEPLPFVLRHAEYLEDD